jgi:tRNA-dihydrouridine synthase
MTNCDTLKNGIVLAELGGYGDGPYCAKYGAGAALVLLGTYIVDAGPVQYPAAFVFKPGRGAYEQYLREHVAAARQSGAAVGVSVICVDNRDNSEFLQAAADAGADYVSLCLHSTMPIFTQRGLSSTVMRRENWPVMRAQMKKIISAVGKPLIVKTGAMHCDCIDAVREMVGVGVEMFHVDVPNAATPLGAKAIRQLREVCPFLIVGGGIRTVEDAVRVLDAGADAVSVATAAMEDPTLCGRIQAALRTTPQR